jgi:hypothetical protein
MSTFELRSVPHFLPEDHFSRLREEILRLMGTERSYIPGHKKGGTIGYRMLRNHAEQTSQFYHSLEHQQCISEMVGLSLKPTPISDESSLSVLIYDRPGDHIGWHYDHNFYWGRHFTVLLALENTGHQDDGLSAGRLRVKRRGSDEVVPTAPNTLVVFEGTQVRHRVTPVEEGERRIMLSMTYCTDPRNWWWQELLRRVKDMSYFGSRALWPSDSE